MRPVGSSTANNDYVRVPLSLYDHAAQRPHSNLALLSAIDKLPHNKLCALSSLLLLSLVLLAAYWLLPPHSSDTDKDYIPLPLDKLLSDYDQPPQLISKIDSDGRYLRWDDITTVMPVRTHLSPAYERGYELMRDKFGHFFTPTPVSSYHVTLTSVIALHFQPSVERYNALITANLRRLERLQLFFAQQTGIITFVVANHSFPLLVGGGYSTTVRLSPKTAEDRARLTHLNATALEILGDMHVDNIAPHMGLGYKRLGWKPRSDEDVQQLVELMKELRSMYEGVEVVVDMPILCSIHNMTDFSPI